MNFTKLPIKIPSVISEVEASLQQYIFRLKQLMEKKRNTKRTFKDVEINVELTGYFEGVQESDVIDFNNKESAFKDYVFAGGAITDLYIDQFTNYKVGREKTDYPFKDVDIFVCNYGFSQDEFGTFLPGAIFEDVLYVEDSYSDAFKIDSIIRFTYKGVSFEIVLLASMGKVHVFDYRFRNFFYKKGLSFASPGALEDIENKRLLATSFHTSGTSFVRGKIFELQYGFKMDKKSKDMLMWDMSDYGTSKKGMLNYLNEKKGIKKSVKEKVLKEVQHLFEEQENIPETVFVSRDRNDVVYFPNTIYPFHEDTRDIISTRAEYQWTEEVYEAVTKYQRHAIFDEKTVMAKDISVREEWLKNQKVLRDLLFMDSLSSLFGDVQELPFGGNNVRYFGEAIDFDILRKFFGDLSVQEQVELLEEWDEENVIIKNLGEWFGEVIKSKSVSGLVMTFLKKFIMKKLLISFSPKTQKTLHVLNGELISVEVKSIVAGNSGRYEFIKTDRGLFTLCDTVDEGSSLFFDKITILDILEFLSINYPNVFDYGQSGDTANYYNYHYSYGGYYFNKVTDSEKQKLVISL